MADENKVKLAEQLFKRGNDAGKSGNFDYAVDCFLKCVKCVPEKLLYRQALRIAERKKYNDNGKGAGMTSMLSMQGAKLKVRTAKGRKKWLEVAEAAEDGLAINPWDVALLYDLSVACKELEFLDCALWVAETAAEITKDRKDVFWLLSELYEATNQFNKAVNALDLVRKIDPNDHEAASKARQMQASETIQRSEAANATRNQTARGAAPSAQPQSDRPAARGAESFEDRLRREANEILERLRADPTNSSIYVQAGDAFRRLGDLEQSVKLYQRGYDVTEGRDQDIKVKLLDCQIDRYRRKQEQLKEQIDRFDRSAPDARERAEQLKQAYAVCNAEVVKREVELYRFRLELNPEDFSANLELGTRYLKLSQPDEAIKVLQQARNDPRIKWQALCWLGVAFWRKKNYPLAEKNLAEAAMILPDGNEDAKKEVFYYRGRVAEDRGERMAAVDYFNEIAAIDFGYRDVSKRLDELNAQES